MKTALSALSEQIRGQKGEKEKDRGWGQLTEIREQRLLLEFKLKQHLYMTKAASRKQRDDVGGILGKLSKCQRIKYINKLLHSKQLGFSKYPASLTVKKNHRSKYCSCCKMSKMLTHVQMQPATCVTFLSSYVEINHIQSHHFHESF